MAKITQEVIVINEGLQERRRTTARGTKSRYTITVKAEPVLHNLSQERLGEGPAMAIRDAIVRQIKGITDVAKPSTILRRRVAARGLAKGQATAVKRYSGGRTGTKAPSGSVRLFNDSSRLADGIFVRQNPKEENWTINVTANRLDPSTFKSMADFVGMVNRLRSYVPVLSNPLGDPAVKDAIRGSLKTLLQKRDDLRLQRNKAIVELLRGVLL